MWIDKKLLSLYDFCMVAHTGGQDCMSVCRERLWNLGNYILLICSKKIGFLRLILRMK